jgi:hypothetical protein
MQGPRGVSKPAVLDASPQREQRGDLTTATSFHMIPKSHTSAASLPDRAQTSATPADNPP